MDGHGVPITDLTGMGIRTYTAEPKRKRRKWKGRERERRAVYANRRRIRGTRGKALLRRRGGRVERPFAHQYETGAMRPTHLRGHANIRKRLLVHSAGDNLALLMRALIGIGKPRVIQGLVKAAKRARGPMLAVWSLLAAPAALLWSLCATRHAVCRAALLRPQRRCARGLSTGC